MTYHDNTAKPEYDAYGHLLDNWCPDLDYGKEHANVHFRIRTKTYDPSDGYFASSTDRTAFYTEVNRLFSGIGWTPENRYNDDVSTIAVHETSNLYLHPQDISGIVKKNDIRKVAEALSHGKTFKFQWVDLYETHYDLTDSEYTAKLRSRWSEIGDAVLAKSATARRKFMYREDYVASAATGNFIIRRVGSDRETDLEFVKQYILDQVIPYLVKAGYLIEAEGADGVRLIRRINKTEQRKKNLSLPVAI